jgi:uncharacterized protein YdiU (UPF0061 family)
MEAFDPATVYSSIDHAGRYAYANQPIIAQWNLARFAEALLPLFADDQQRAIDLAVEALGGFSGTYDAAWSSGMRAKLGLSANTPDQTVTSMATELLAQLQQSHVDYTSFFRRLGAAARGDAEPARGLFVDLATFDDWLTRWRGLAPDAEVMDRANPVYIPRNHLVEEALAAATSSDLDPLERLLQATTSPFVERPGLERFAAPAPDDFGPYQTFCGT